jgi:hypothetical protein
MSFRRVSLLLATTLLTTFAPANADEKAASAASQRFEALKKLAGDWVEVGKDGKPTDKIVTSFRVIAAGSVIAETVYPGTDHEMATMYHLDGPDLLLTHYCTFGNQPRMRAEPGENAEKIVFKYIGATNLKSKDEQHMDQATLAFDGKDHFQTEWIACKDGTACHKHVANLVRKQK